MFDKKAANRTYSTQDALLPPDSHRNRAVKVGRWAQKLALHGVPGPKS
jgi:hypothetical protein